MRIKKNLLTVILFCFILNLANAQIKQNKNKSQTFKPYNLKIGDHVPNIFIPKIVHDKYHSIHFQDIKAPLIILDFWAVNCGSCISALPKLDSMQNEFASQLKILPITYNTTSAVLKFFNSKNVKNIKLPTVVEDKNLTLWFKHWAISHEVWIYKGKVVAITDPSYVTSINIKLILAGKAQNWPVKDDYKVIDENKPFITKFEPTPHNYFIDISPYKTEFHSVKRGSGFVRDTLNNTTKYFIFNNTILNAYRIIWSALGKPIGQISLEVKDKSKYEYDSKYGAQIEWLIKNGFCYESILPTFNKTDKERYQDALADLDRFFGLKTIWETRKTICKVLYITNENNLNLIKTHGGEQKINSIIGNIHQFRNISLANLLYYLNQNKRDEVIINHADFNDYYIDIDLPQSSFENFDLTRAQLQQYGLDIKNETHDIETFCIKEID